MGQESPPGTTVRLTLEENGKQVVREVVWGESLGTLYLSWVACGEWERGRKIGTRRMLERLRRVVYRCKIALMAVRSVSCPVWHCQVEEISLSGAQSGEKGGVHVHIVPSEAIEHTVYHLQNFEQSVHVVTLE